MACLLEKKCSNIDLFPNPNISGWFADFKRAGITLNPVNDQKTKKKI